MLKCSLWLPCFPLYKKESHSHRKGPSSLRIMLVVFCRSSHWTTKKMFFYSKETIKTIALVGKISLQTLIYTTSPGNPPDFRLIYRLLWAHWFTLDICSMKNAISSIDIKLNINNYLWTEYFLITDRLWSFLLSALFLLHCLLGQYLCS